MDRLTGGPHIDPAFRQRGQLLVGHALLVERLLQHGGTVVTAELARPRDQAAVAGDLVVLGGLSSVDQCGVQHVLVGDLAGNLVGLLQKTLDEERATDKKLTTLAESKVNLRAAS